MYIYARDSFFQRIMTGHSYLSAIFFVRVLFLSSYQVGKQFRSNDSLNIAILFAALLQPYPSSSKGNLLNLFSSGGVPCLTSLGAANPFPCL
jgi:hypothetical protein